MAELEFLNFPVSNIRRTIRDIDSSYRNPWDIYAELAQNAVDAIRKVSYGNNEKKLINIDINAVSKSIVFQDNGCGISLSKLPSLLSLFSSDKGDDNETVGEKGVGLKFVYFSSSYFEIESSDGVTGGKAIIKDACLWKKSTSEEMLKLELEEEKDLPRGTKITIRNVELDSEDEDSVSIFNLSFEQLKYILRSKTYLGNTNSIWDSDSNDIVINLNYKDFNGLTHSEVLKNSYVLPTEVLSPTDSITIKEFEDWLLQKDRTDTDKRNKLQGKVLVDKGEYLHNNYRKIKYYACFLPTRRDWRVINEAFGLIPQGVDESYEAKYQYCLLSSGICTAIKGMPTGITIENPNTGNAGYWPNMFMIFQDDALSFDIGRKSIHGKTQAIYRNKAKEIFNNIIRFVTRYTTAVPVTAIPTNSFDRYKVRQDVDNIVNLNSPTVKFQKLPSEQEAAVSAIFFELIGNNVIDDITPVYLGYRQKYDLYALYTPSSGTRTFGFYEFKSHLRHLTKDFSEARKVFDELDYVICWDVNDTDIQNLSEFGINCDEIPRGGLHAGNHPKSVTHMLTIPNCNPVFVIDLKKLM